MADRNEPETGSQGDLSSSRIRAQLEKILTSETFARSGRLSAFLRFIVDETLEGNGVIKEQFIAQRLYGRGPEFEAASDPIVRVDARRLRDKLREYYVESTGDSIVISVPKGSYVPAFSQSPTASAQNAGPVPALAPPTPSIPRIASISKRNIGWILAALAVAASAAAVLFVDRSTKQMPNGSAELRPLTSLTGEKSAGSLSPDGNFIVFGWSGRQDPSRLNLYIKAVEGESLRQLTDHSGRDESPAWSPDGQQIAFVRAGHGVFLISQAGGYERRIADSGTHVGWSTDAKSVFIRDREGDSPYAIFQVALENLERRRLTRAHEGMGDWRFDESPDGKTLAFVRFAQPGAGDIYTVPVQGGEPRRVTNCNGSIDGLAWTPDGHEIVYDVSGQGGARLWRIPADLKSPAVGTRLDEIPDAMLPSISRPRPGKAVRLAYQTRRRDLGMHLWRLKRTPASPSLAAPVALDSSTRDEFGGSFSPDSSRIAFASDRGGGLDIWISGWDGSVLHRVTHTNGVGTAHPAWSPDGSLIAFQSAAHGNPDVYVVGAEGGAPRRVTSSEFRDAFPSWSHDGAWIYFASDRSGTFQIWKVRASGGEPVRVTENGGFEAHESGDGTLVYFLARPRAAGSGTMEPSKLMQVSISGGPPAVLIERVWPFHWSVARQGIYYLTLDGPRDEVVFYNFSTKRTTRVATLPSPISRADGRASVSPDGRWLLTTYVERDDADFMVIHDFR